MQKQQMIDEQRLRKLFEKSADVQFQTYMFGESRVLFVTCDAMIDQQLLHQVIVNRLHQFFEQKPTQSLEKEVLQRLHIPEVQQVTDINELLRLVYTGNVLLLFEDQQILFSSNIEKKPNRNPEETKLEVIVKGPRDDFIEDLSVNIALMRKRLPTNSLCVEKFELGRRTKTGVAILYFDDIANKEILQAIIDKIQKIDTDIVFSGDILMEAVNKNSKLFPRNDYTGRPDHAIQSLARGRFLIFVDGVSYGMITPVNLFLLLKSGEDNENPSFYSSFERILRLAGILIGALLPAFWLALTTFHQNQLPLQLLATVVQANKGLPFPSAFEMLVMVLMFELFREASLRLPSAIGATLGVVGGLIIGDAAIRAGITSPAMIVIIATSTIATFTLVNQSLVTAVSLLRFIFIIITAFLGLFGFFMSLYFTLIYLASIFIFGVSYLNIATDLSWSTIAKSLFRLPQNYYKKRPKMLRPNDKTRSSEAKK